MSDLLNSPVRISNDDTQYLIQELLDQGVIQRCPKGCLVEKISGCNFIECKCGEKFCWNCHKPKGPEGCPYGNIICNSH